MSIKEMYDNVLYKDIGEYYERIHDLDDTKYVALLCKELKKLKKFYNCFITSIIKHMTMMNWYVMHLQLFIKL